MVQVGRAGIAALAAVLVIDVALVALAVRHVQATGPTTPVSDSLPEKQKQEKGKENPEPEPEPEPEPTPETGGTMINIGEGPAVVRAVAGVCGTGGGKVELSLDGGQSWQPAELEGADVIVRVSSVNGDSASVIAADAECGTYTTYETADGGGTWTTAEGTDGRWHELADPQASVHAPSGLVEVSCEQDQPVVSLSLLTADQGFALCGDGALLVTTDGGASWSPLGSLSGVADLDFLDTSTGLGVAPVGSSDDCAGVPVSRTSDGGQAWEQASCIETEAAGEPDISTSSDGRMFVSVGEQVWFSSDSGDSWAQP